MDKKSEFKKAATSIKENTASEIIKIESEFSDTWITTKVKSSLIYTIDVPGLSIKVSTNNGVVTLSGCVFNSSERVSAIKSAINVSGVKAVISKDLVAGTSNETIK